MFSWQLGAVDILRTPIASQQDRLATLWQHAVRKGKEQPSALPKSEKPEAAEIFQHAADAISEVCTCCFNRLNRSLHSQKLVTLGK